MTLLGVMAVYDFFAVRFGYMLWLAGRLSESNSLPAFIIPRRFREWRTSLTQHTVAGLADVKPAERSFSILGGGDIAFPVLLVSSVFFVFGAADAVLIAGLSLAGLIGAYLVQAFILKGKPMPGLPPIAVLCLIGMLIIR
jgi:presenilin-like A22 family membrane protease